MLARRILGTLAGLTLMASACAHGVPGWKQFQSELERAGVAADFVDGLHVGWLFGSAAFVIFALVAFHAAATAGSRAGERHVPVALVGLGLISFGAWAFISRDFNAFFLVFVVMGALSLAAGLVTSRR